MTLRESILFILEERGIVEVVRRSKTSRGVAASRKAGFVRSNVYRSIGDKFDPKSPIRKMQSGKKRKTGRTKFKNRKSSRERRRFFSHYKNTKASKAGRFVRLSLSRGRRTR